jgi:hypothetical protein
MKTGLKYILLAWPVVLVSCQSISLEPQKAVVRFVERYRAAKTETNRRNLCIELMDSDLLYSGSSIDCLKTIFGTDFQEQGMLDAKTKLAIVHFKRSARFNDPLIPVDWTGWFLSVKYRPDGHIMAYSMSNESKTRSAQLGLKMKHHLGQTNVPSGLPPIN